MRPQVTNPEELSCYPPAEMYERITKEIPLGTLFDLAAAGGWAPNHPASADELAGLQRSTTRGDCIAPLVIEGDEIFMDPSVPPEPFDLVQFTLSARGAEIQNSNLPPGQKTWKKGDGWVKLYVRNRGLDMLLDRHGSAACATLLSCESPDDVPKLTPIRQIRRNGRFLFAADTHSGQIGINAATDIYLASSNTTSSFNFVPPGHQPFNKLIVTTAPTFDCDVIITITLNARIVSGASSGDVFLEAAYDDTGTGASWQYSTTQTPITTTLAPYTLQWQFSHSRSNPSTYAGMSFYDANTGSSITVANDYYTVQAEYVKR